MSCVKHSTRDSLLVATRIRLLRSLGEEQLSMTTPAASASAAAAAATKVSSRST